MILLSKRARAAVVILCYLSIHHPATIHSTGFTSNSLKSAEENQNSKKQTTSKTILFLGNSLTAGRGLDMTLAFPNLIQQRIDSLHWNFDVINAGLSGETSSGGLRRLNWLLRRKIDVMVVELGANDGLRGIDVRVTKSSLQGIIDLAKEKYPKVEVVLAGMQVPPNMGPLYAEQFQKLFTDLADSNKTALVPFLLEGVAGRPELNLPDGIHPTSEGHQIIADNIWNVLKPILGKMNVN